MIDTEVPAQPRAVSRIRTAVAKLVAGKAWPAEPPETTSASGFGVTNAPNWYKNMFKIATDRLAVYTDAEEMDNTVDEAAAALDLLADNAVNSEGGAQQSFWIDYESGSAVAPVVKTLIEDTIERVRWHEKAYSITRDTLLYGDTFLQLVVDPDLQLCRLMWMPPSTMVRNEDQQGLLIEPGSGDEGDDWPFEQYLTSPKRKVAEFYAWQMMHIRWNRRNSSEYGRSHFYTARTSWKKLQAMEEAMVINWLTRAFARLLLILDVTGKTDDEAQEVIKKFISELSVRKIASGVEGAQTLSVVKDIFIGRGIHDIAGKPIEGLTDVKVLDTSTTGFTNLNPVEYYQNKMLISLHVPKAYLGLERDINAKATLVQQDRRFARSIRRVQSVISEAIAASVNFSLVVNGVDPRLVPYLVMWPAPSIADVVTESIALKNQAAADTLLVQMGVIDREYVAMKHLRMSPTEWAQVVERVQAEAARTVGTVGAVGDEDREDANGGG